MFRRAWDRVRCFSALKYGVYAILTADAVYYTTYEVLAAPYVFRNGVAWSELIEAYPATIDAWAWLVLLWMFELETWLIPEGELRGALKWALHGLRGACYVLGFYSFYGYLMSLELVHGFAPVAIADPCQLRAAGFSLMVDLPEYVPIDAANCTSLAGVDLYRLGERRILTDGETLAYSVGMAWSAIINAGAWLLVVLALEADVWLERRDLLVGWRSLLSNGFKALLYAVLLGVAAYWGFESGFVDLLDALLWLAAFAFIELNLFAAGEPPGAELALGPAC